MNRLTLLLLDYQLRSLVSGISYCQIVLLLSALSQRDTGGESQLTAMK